VYQTIFRSTNKHRNVGDESEVQGRSPGRGPKKLKQFADIVYRCSLQKRSEFENVAQFTS